MIVNLGYEHCAARSLGPGHKPERVGAEWQAAYSSELLGLEARRVINRQRLELALVDRGVAQAQQTLLEIEKGIGTILLSRLLLDRASLPMPTVVKTVDAIHLTIALLFQKRREKKLVFATHDTGQATGAKPWALK